MSNGRRVLVKSGVGVFNQEPYNEVIAAELHRRLPDTFVEYRMITEDRRTYCVCDNFLESDEELVSSWDLIRGRKQRNSESDFMFYVRCCEELGLMHAMYGLARMFGCGHVLASRDRRWRNFGIMRDMETLRATRLAPIFDTGSCLWSDAIEFELTIDYRYVGKPFKRDGMRPEEQRCRMPCGECPNGYALPLSGDTALILQSTRRDGCVSEWAAAADVLEFRIV